MYRGLKRSVREIHFAYNWDVTQPSSKQASNTIGESDALNDFWSRLHTQYSKRQRSLSSHWTAEF